MKTPKQIEPKYGEPLDEMKQAVMQLFEPPLPDALEYLKDEWWKTPPDTTEGQLKILHLRIQQASMALAHAFMTISDLSDQVEKLTLQLTDAGSTERPKPQ